MRKLFTPRQCDDQACASAKLCMPDLGYLVPFHKTNRNAAAPFCNTGKINSICHRTTPQKVNHANRRCSAHADAIFTQLVSMKRKYDNENDRSNDCCDHTCPSAEIGRKADDIAVCFITPQNTHPHGIRLPIMSCQYYTRRCAACQTLRCSACNTAGNTQKSTLSGAFLHFLFRLTRRALRAWPRRPRPCRRRCRRCSS